MKSTPLQCLFCQHINPADAVFCNSCASQLDLKPCVQCSAVDNRNALHCYKCGAAFTPLKKILHPMRLDKDYTPTLRYPAYQAQAQEEPKRLIATQNKRGSYGMRHTWAVVVSALVLCAISLLTFNFMGLSLPAAKAAHTSQKNLPSTQVNELTTVRALAPPGGDMVVTQRLPVPTITRVQTQRASSEPKDCALAVAALGLCNPDLPKE